MGKRQPMLMVNLSRETEVYCSLCGAGFDLHGSAEHLIEAFKFHVHKEHIERATQAAGSKEQSNQ